MSVNVVLVALYRYRNFPIRMMHPLLENIDGIKPYSIFFKDCRSNVFSHPTKREEDLFIDIVLKLNPRIIGFSVLSPYVSVARRLTSLIKKHNSSTLVIWGGIHPTIAPDSCIDDVDMLCIGEGEGALTDLVECLRDAKPHQYIKNLWVKNNGHIIKNPMRPLIQDLDSLPFPSYGNDAYCFIDLNKVSKKDSLTLDYNFWVQTSRGCPYVCSYCVNSLLRPMFKELGSYSRRRSVGNVIREIKENVSLPKSAIDNIFFVDEGFGEEEPWINEFELRYKKEVGLPFYALYNPKRINALRLSKLVNAGLNTIQFGIQAGTDDIRNRIFHRPEQNSEIIGIANEVMRYNLKLYCDLILDNPYDTEQSLESTIRLILQLPRKILFNLHSLQFFPNYPLTIKAMEDGYIKPGTATAETLVKRTTLNWAFNPKMFPYMRKQMLQNIIWLITKKRVKDKIAIYSVFGNTRISRLCLRYLNFKSIVLGKVFGVGGIMWGNRWIPYLANGMGYILKGDLRTFYRKTRKHILYRLKP